MVSPVKTRLKGIGLLLAALATAAILLYVLFFPGGSMTLHPELLAAYLLVVVAVALWGAWTHLST